MREEEEEEEDAKASKEKGEEPIFMKRRCTQHRRPRALFAYDRMEQSRAERRDGATLHNGLKGLERRREENKKNREEGRTPFIPPSLPP